MKDKCYRCNRRMFVRNLGFAAGVSAMSGGMSSFFAGCDSNNKPLAKANSPKVRVIFVIKRDEEVQVTPDWPNVGYDFRPQMKLMTDSLNAGVGGIEFVAATAQTPEDAKAIAEQDASAGEVIGYVVVQMNPWHDALYGLLGFGKPILYTTLPYAGDGGWLSKNSYIRNGQYIREGWPECKDYESIATFRFADVVAMAKAFETTRGGKAGDFAAEAKRIRLSLIPSESGIAAKEDPIDCLTPEATLAAVKGKKILVLEKGWGDDTARITEDLGIVFENVKFDELNAAWEKVGEERARPLMEEWKHTAEAIDGVDDETLMGVARMSFAMNDLLVAHDAVALTIDCLGGCYSGKLKAYPCLGFMELQDSGLLGTCEADLASVTAMLVFNAMTKGRVGYISDPVLDASTRSISYAHCVSTRQFFGVNGPKAPFEILTHSEDREGASVRAIAPIGYPVTTVKLSCALKKIVVHTGVIVDNDRDDRACRTKMVVEVKGDYDKLQASKWYDYSWHRITFVGDFAESVKHFAEYLGYEYVTEA